MGGSSAYAKRHHRGPAGGGKVLDDGSAIPEGEVIQGGNGSEMAERNLMRDLGVGLVTTVLSFGGGWTLQSRQNADAQKAQAELKAADDRREEESRRKAEEAEAKRQREFEAIDLWKRWKDPAIAEKRRIARRLIESSGRRNYRALMEEASVTEEQKLALEHTLGFFTEVRALAAGARVDVTLARQMLGTDPLWWSQHGMPKLLQRWGESPVPPELTNAASGIAALGGDLMPLSPPLQGEVILHFLQLGPELTVAGRTNPRTSGPQVVAASVASTQENVTLTLFAETGQIDTLESSKAEWLRCLAKVAGNDTEGKPVGTWYTSLDPAARKRVDMQCLSSTQSTGQT